MPHLKVVIPSYNSVKWIKKTLTSVVKQTHRDFDVCVIDDASTDLGQREIIQEYCKEQNWKNILRQTNHGALANIIDGIKHLSPSDEDIIILLDGDDWLYDQAVFKKIADTYEKEPVNMTYGQFITYPQWNLGLCAPMSKGLLRKRNFREVPFIFSHLRTFKFKLWKNIREEDFKDPSGHFFKTAWDLAIMYPLLEMTGGESCKFINDILYVYNMDNPIGDGVAHAKTQYRTAQHISKKACYPRLFYEKCVHHRINLSQEVSNRWQTIYRKIMSLHIYLALAGRKLHRIILRCFRGKQL